MSGFGEKVHPWVLEIKKIDRVGGEGHLAVGGGSGCWLGFIPRGWK